MRTLKFVLIVATDASPLHAVEVPMADLGYRVARATSCEAAVAAIVDAPRLSAVLIDGGLEGALSVLAEVTNRHGGLPVIWWQQAASRPSFTERKPSAIFTGPLDVGEVVARTDRHFCDEFFPPSVVQSFYNAANSVLATTFQVAVDLGEPWTEFSESLPGDAAALIGFGGTEVAGHVLVIGTRAHLAALAREIGLDEGDGDRRLAIDVLGELSNQIVGQVKASSAKLMGDVQLGLPYVMLGEHIDLHFGTTKPFVRMLVSVAGGDIFVDFALQKLSVTDASRLDQGLIAAGELELF